MGQKVLGPGVESPGELEQQRKVKLCVHDVHSASMPSLCWSTYENTTQYLCAETVPQKGPVSLLESLEIIKALNTLAPHAFLAERPGTFRQLSWIGSVRFRPSEVCF